MDRSQRQDDGVVAQQSHEPQEVADRLCSSIGIVLKAIPDCSMRPTDIARLLGVSRVMVGRVLSNIAKDEFTETLIGIPGPETLRLILNAAGEAGVDEGAVETALEAVDSFDELIRERYGTRGAMSAALSTGHTDERERFDQSSRYQAFKGMSSILGVESKVWLTSMMMTPSADSESGIDVTTIHGTTGLRQLRPNIPVHFVYGKPPEYLTGRQMPVRIELDPEQFFSNTPAPLAVREENGQIINTFAPEVIGKDAVYDMFAGVHVPNGSGRYAKEGRSYRGTIVTPDVPVITLVSDVILHGDIFEGIEPELFVHNTVAKGGADIEDPKRAVDRIQASEEIVDLGYGLKHMDIPEIPKYAQMIDYMCQRTDTQPSDFRVHRLQIQYPVYGFQYAIAFKVL
ncbi:MAG: hypothetical protein P1U30_03035 [Phycisphaerales bacterium]|nr:hypothetical protein [Phycisphaerales bacterium]